LKGVGPKTIEKIEAHGVSSIEKLADMTPEQLTAIPGIGEKMVEKIQLSVAAHFQSLEQQQVAGEAAPPAELEEQPGEAEQLASEEPVAEGAVPEELDAAAEQYTEVDQEAAPQSAADSAGAAPQESNAVAEQNTEVNQEAAPQPATDHVENASADAGASDDETIEQKEKSRGE
jgi:N utilization substance protein A